MLEAIPLFFHVDETWVVVDNCRPETRIPDLLLMELDLDALGERASRGLLRPLKKSELTVLRVLRTDRGMVLDTICSKTGMRREAVRRVLSMLKSDGYVRQMGKASFARCVSAKSVAKRIISIEMKRSDWRGALSQANAHQRFAHEAFVVFDSHYRPRFARSLPRFRMMGVGLIELDARDGNHSRLLPARKSRPLDSTAKTLAGEKLLAALQGFTMPVLPETRLRDVPAQTSCRAALPQHRGRLGRRLPRRLAVSLPQLAALL